MSDIEYIAIAGIGVIAIIGGYYLVKELGSLGSGAEKDYKNLGKYINKGKNNLAYDIINSNPITKLNIANQLKTYYGKTYAIFNKAKVIFLPEGQGSGWINNYISTYTGKQALIFAFDVNGVLQSSTFIPISNVKGGSVNNAFTYSKGWQGVGYYKGAYDSNVIIYITTKAKYKSYYEYNKPSKKTNISLGTLSNPYKPFVKGWQGVGYYKSYLDQTPVIIGSKIAFNKIYNVISKTENRNNYSSALILGLLYE